MELQSFLQYIQYEKRYSAHTCSAYETDLKQFQVYLLEHYEQEDLKAVENSQIRSWIMHLMQGRQHARTIHRKLSSLKSFYKFLLRQGLIAQTPFQKIFLPKKPKRLPNFVEQDKMQELLLEKPVFSDDFAGLRDRCLVELLYGTGMRRGELVQLCSTDIDLYQGNVRIQGKGSKMRVIPIGPTLKAVIEEYLKARQGAFPEVLIPQLLLSNTGKAIYPSFVYQTVRRYLGYITSAQKRSPHVLRHTFATHLSNNGADLNAIKELLGHANLAATQLYTHNSIERLKEAYQKAHPKSGMGEEKP